MPSLKIPQGYGREGNVARPDVPRLAIIRSWLVDRWMSFVSLATLAILAVPRLGQRSLWSDEAFSVGSVEQLGRTATTFGGTMVLYYTTMVPVVAWTHDPRWLRLPALLAMGGAVWFLWKAGTALGGKAFAGTATGIFVLSWFTIRYATEVRGFGLSLLLVALSWFALIRWITGSEIHHQRRWWLIWTVVIILAPLAHGMAALQFVVQGAALVFAPNRRYVFGHYVGTAIPFGMTMAVLFAFGAGDVGVHARALHRGQIGSIYLGMIGPIGWAGAILGVAFIAGLWIGTRDAWLAHGVERFVKTVPLFWALGLPILILAISIVKPYAVARYFITSLPGIALVIAIGLRSVNQRTLRIALYAAVAAALLSGHTGQAMTANEEWGQAVAVVAGGAEDSDALVATGGGARAAFDLAWAGAGSEARLEAVLPGGEVGVVRRFYPEDVTSATASAMLRGGTYKRVWVIGRGKSKEGIEIVRQLNLETRFEVVKAHDLGSVFVLELEAR